MKKSRNTAQICTWLLLIELFPFVRTHLNLFIRPNNSSLWSLKRSVKHYFLILFFLLLLNLFESVLLLKTNFRSSRNNPFGFLSLKTRNFRFSCSNWAIRFGCRNFRNALLFNFCGLLQLFNLLYYFPLISRSFWKLSNKMVPSKDIRIVFHWELVYRNLRKSGSIDPRW